MISSVFHSFGNTDFLGLDRPADLQRRHFCDIFIITYLHSAATREFGRQHKFADLKNLDFQSTPLLQTREFGLQPIFAY
jgi:hypothetical protein